MRFLLLFLLFAVQMVGFGANTVDLQNSNVKKELTLEKSDLNERSYKQFRFYDPNSGTYISQDPIGLHSGEPNFYAYVTDCNSWIDPFGLSGFFNPSTFNAPSGNTHTVFQQNIDWNLPVNTRDGVKTNLELAEMGRSPFVVKDGKYSQIQLHHSKQNAKGSLFELSAATHQKYKGSNALHPHLPNKHPINPVSHDDLWKADREAYWMERAKKAKGCH